MTNRMANQAIAVNSMNSPRIPILMYHSISDDASAGFKTFTVRPAMFEAQLGYLASQSYTPITISQLVAVIDGQAALPERPVVLTFDDGFADFYTHASPALKRYQFPATLYVATGYVGETSRWLQAEGEAERPMLTWQQLIELCAEGIECGAHTHTHPQLDSIAPAQVRTELQESRRQLEQHLQIEIPSFCYPFGYYSSAVKHVVQELGYKSACAVRRQISSLIDDRFALSRLIVTHELSLPQFARLLAGHSAPGNLRSDRIKTFVWRLVRRTTNKRQREAQ